MQASDSSIGLINPVQSGVLLVAYGLWIYFSRRWGAGKALTPCAFGLALYPLLTAASTSVWPLLLHAGITGLFVAGTDLVIFDVLLGAAPETARGTAVGLYHTTNYLATFGAPPIGTAPANYVGIGAILSVAARLRLLGEVLFLGLGLGHSLKSTP